MEKGLSYVFQSGGFGRNEGKEFNCSLLYYMTALGIKKRLIYWTSLKLRKSTHRKTLGVLKGKPQSGKIYLQYIYSTEDPVPRIYKVIPTNKYIKQLSQFFTKGQKAWKDILQSRDPIGIFKRLSTQFVLKEMQMKPAMKSTFTRIATFNITKQ